MLIVEEELTRGESIFFCFIFFSYSDCIPIVDLRAQSALSHPLQDYLFLSVRVRRQMHDSPSSVMGASQN